MGIGAVISIISIITGVILTFVGFLLKWIFNQFDKKIDLLFDKVDEMVKQSELDSLKNQVNSEIEKKEIRFKELEAEIKQIKQTQDRCKSCQS